MGYGFAEDARKFFEPRLGTFGDPFALGGMEATVDRLLFAIDRRDRLGPYGNPSCEGARREVRRMLAERSRKLPERYWKGGALRMASAPFSGGFQRRIQVETLLNSCHWRRMPWNHGFAKTAAPGRGLPARKAA